MKITQLVKGSIWQLESNLTLNRSVILPKGTRFQMKYSRVESTNLAPIKILDNPPLSQMLSRTSRSSPTYGTNRGRYQDADALVSIELLKDITFIEGKKTEFYIRRSDGKFLNPKEQWVNSIETARFFVSLHSAMKHVYFHNIDAEIIEYDPFDEVSIVSEICPDWIETINNLNVVIQSLQAKENAITKDIFSGIGSNTLGKILSGKKPSRLVADYRAVFLPNNGKLVGIGIVSSTGIRSAISLLKDSVVWHSIHGNVIGFDSLEDITLIKISLGDNIEVFKF